MQFIENEVKEVGKGVWIRVAVDNISWCDLGENAAVIDALEETDQADVVRDLITQTTGKDLKYVVTTHWDVDHIACNPQWKREGALVIAHQSCADSAGDGEGRPDISYDDKAVLKGTTEEIQMQWGWRHAHAVGHDSLFSVCQSSAYRRFIRVGIDSMPPNAGKDRALA